MKVSIIIKCSFYLLSIIFFSGSLFSQALVKSKWRYNSELIQKSGELKTKIASRSSTAQVIDTISLGARGIIDDFSYSGPYPDTSIWLDDEVYINRGFAISPISIGVATFDGLAANGYPYNFFAGVASQPADTLTSKPIDLSANNTITVGDSVYLSFYYQPQGFGNDPQHDDSLMLEFKVPQDTTWTYIWSKHGRALASGDSSFNLVMIPITNPSFFKRGFQFRFRNYASINAAADQWNLDYVYLNTSRTAHDSIFADVAWVYNGASLLKNYTSMPWRQYTSSEIRTNTNNLIRNNDVVRRSLNYHYQQLNLTTGAVLNQFDGASNIYPFLTNKIYTDCDVSIGCVNSVTITASNFPSTLSGPTKLGIKHYYTISDFIPQNDTLLVVGDFSNYFAYDDGTAESELGLRNASGAQFAIKFTLNVADTLGALDIYFDPFITNAELYGFYLNVWNDNGGTPGSLIYTGNSLFSPVYEKKGPNVFARYYLDSPRLLSAGTYYIGFTQPSDSVINIGLDLNNNSQSNTFLKYAGTIVWQTSSIAGAIMMRPVFGNNIINPNSINVYSDINTTISVYPNPVNDKLYLQSQIFKNPNKVSYQIMDIFGNTILEGNYSLSDYIDVSSLASGVYFIKAISGTEVATNKFIKIN
jgi:hypothetical protein